MKKFVLAVFAILTAFFGVSFLILTSANAHMMSKNAKLIARGKKLF